MPPDMQKKPANLDPLVKKVTVVDWYVVNEHRAQRDVRCNRQIEQ